MTQATVDFILDHVLPSAEDDPLVFIQLMVIRAVKEHGDNAVLQFADACRDMGQWYSDQANALEAEGRARGHNVVPMAKGGEARIAE